MIYGFSFAFFVFQYDPDECYTEHGAHDSNNDDDDAPFCTLVDSTLTTLTFFYSGPERTGTWWLDLLFGLMAVVILLNVVIAIVSDAWAETQEEAIQAFWRYRINYLIENSALVTQYDAVNKCIAKIGGKRLRKWLHNRLQDDGKNSSPFTRWLLSLYSGRKPKKNNLGGKESKGEKETRTVPRALQSPLTALVAKKKSKRKKKERVTGKRCKPSSISCK